MKNAVEGWYVPAYVIKGDPARNLKPLAPELKSVADLKRYPQVFKDPEAPTKGRFLNSPSGWTSEIVNTQKLKAYALEGYTPIFAPAPAPPSMPRSARRFGAASPCCSITGAPRP